MSTENLILEDFGRAIGRLGEVLSLAKNDVIRDSAIQRFEICFELAWKAVKHLAKKEGKECHSPKACFRLAFQFGWIEHDEKWLEMVDDRNLTAHVYKEEYAEKIYSHLASYLILFRSLLGNLKGKS
ncbi:MAG: nucleotidyltransferase substrate binding protein [Elusimicrobia bacterium]|nr:nucleotidyltransferase substrate binding protein [Elusimicrobiota bacterium]